MMMDKKLFRPAWLLKIAIIFFIALILFAGGCLAYEKIYDGKIYPGVYLGDINLGGLTKDQAQELLNQKVNTLNQSGIIFYFDNHQSTLLPVVASADAELAYILINFNASHTVDLAYAYGRSKNALTNFLDKIDALIIGNKIGLNFTIDEGGVKKVLKENFSQFDNPAVDAKLIYDGDAKKINNFTVEPEKIGAAINYQSALEQLKSNLLNLDASTIELIKINDYPEIYKKDVLNLNRKINQIMSRAPLTLKYEKISWAIDQNQLALWLALKLNSEPTGNDKVDVSLNRQAVEEFLKNEVAVKIDKKPVEARFEIKNGKVAVFQTGADGLEFDLNSNLDKIENDFINDGHNDVSLVVREIKSSSDVDQTNNFGIKEIIGTGHSNFAGSPANRRHNIATGANTLNGILIKPEEEFSLLAALGEIDAESGYLQELVIKGDKTVPEFGGGLCQIGTTMFRAVLASGLPITERRNHSYRVVYYEPAGTDATIYNPAPDFKFINDTGNYILIQARIEGDDIYFDFWGSKDGRAVEKTDPTIYNIVRPGPAKIIETTDLPVGLKKCTERAHNGADAYFDYKVTYADGTIKEKRFSSHYVPWQEICLVGVAKKTDSEGSQTASSTIQQGP